MTLAVNLERLHSIAVGGGCLEFRVRHSQRKTLAISVRPDGSVIATAPQNADVATITSKIRKRGRWIQRQKRYFERFLPSTPARKYVSGETHQYLGRQYRLKVSLGYPNEAKLVGQYLHVAART